MTAIRFGVLSKLVSSIVTALVIGLVASWQLALLMMICFATVAVSSFLQLKLIQGRSNKNKELLENSAKTASEAFRNSRTVIGLGLGDRFCQTYNEKLDSPFRYKRKEGRGVGGGGGGCYWIGNKVKIVPAFFSSGRI